MSSKIITTPADLDGLRELVLDISRKDCDISMGSKTLAVLGKMVEHPEQTALSTISELALSMQVNPSTLSRLAKSLGYSGFPEFQRVFRQDVSSQGGRFYTHQASRLLDKLKEGEQSVCLATVAQLSQESVRNIEHGLAQLDELQLGVVSKALAHARRVRIHGVRQIHAVSSLLQYGLSLIRPDVSLLDGPGQGVAEGLANMSEGDVLVVATVSPYSRIVTETAALAKQQGVQVIAITDYRTSPLVASAQSVFFLPHDSSFISNSMAAYIVLCEGLVNLVAQELGAQALQSLERQEQFIEQLHIELG